MKEQNTTNENAKPFDFSLWITIIAIGLAIFNVILFITYKYANPEQDFWKQLWAYFESNTFQVLTVSLAFPIILLLLENHFNFIKGAMESRREREKREIEERNERRKKLEQDRREKRLEAIEKTAEVLRQINASVSKVRFFDNNNSSNNINDILREIASLSIAVSEVINIWTFRFPILPKSTHTLFADYVRLLYWGAWAVAHCIQNENKLKTLVKDLQIRDLQEYLAMIQRGVVGTGFHPIFNCLNYSMNLLESIEELSKELSKDNKERIPYREDEVQHSLIEIIKSKIDENVKTNFKKLDDQDGQKGEMYKIIEREANKSNKYQPSIPITAVWIECELKRKEIVPTITELIFEDIKKAVSPDIQEKIGRIIEQSKDKESKDNHSSIMNQIENNEDVKQKKEQKEMDHAAVLSKKKMQKEVEGLILNIFKLKIYQLLLGIDRFRKEEILPPIDSKTACSDADNLRKLYQEIQEYIEKDPDTLDIKKPKFRQFLTTDQYQKFMKSFFEVQDLDLMNIIAIDTTKRIKEIGRLMRFATTISFDEENIEAVQ